MDAITWNHDLVAKQQRENRFFARVGIIFGPIWLLAILADAEFFRRGGDITGVYAVLRIGLICFFVLAIGTVASCILKLRQVRKIPVIAITESEIRIGSVLIRQSDILRVETGIRGRNRRRFRMHLQDGSTRLLAVPRGLSVETVKTMFRTSLAVTDRNLLFPL